jgi:hypothetical protein
MLKGRPERGFDPERKRPVGDPNAEVIRLVDVDHDVPIPLRLAAVPG